MSFREKGPTFICIGPEKTGTSWLYINLKKHPQVSLPPFKEIRYFWEKIFLPDESIIKMFTDQHWHYQSIRRNLRRNLRDACLSKDPKRIVWCIKFMLLPHTDEWYVSLFNSSETTVSGDISPLYYMLPEEEIERISSLLPNLKILIFLRNPVDRAWSKAKMNLCIHKNREFRDVLKREFFEHFEREFKILNSYVDLINSWTKYFPKRNILVKYYDELMYSPNAFMQSILTFLSIKSDFYSFKELQQKINKGLEMNIPEEFGKYLAQLYEGCIREMYNRDFPYSQEWLERNNTLCLV